MSLYEDVTRALQDRDVVACVMESELEPVSGPGTPISPPTYAPDLTSSEKGSGVAKLDRRSRFAMTDQAFMPVVGAGGWHHAFARTSDGELRRSTRVVVNSVGACAGVAETALWTQQDRLAVAWPAFIVDGAATSAATRTTAIDKAAKGANGITPGQLSQVTEALTASVCTWTLAHRTADSWLQYADAGDGQQIWADEGGHIREVLLNISHGRGDLVYSYAPNVAVFGAWLSSGSAQRHAIPRAYSCEITGFSATPVQRAATKLDPTGGSVKGARKIGTVQGGIALVDKGGREPSALGFGQVPAPVADRAVSCELILRQASISFRALDLFRYPEDPDGVKALAAKRVYVLLAMAGHVLGGQEGFLRSGCDLVTVEERWGWRRHGERMPKDIKVPSAGAVAEALRQAIDAAAEVGLTFQAPVIVGFSEAEVGLIVDRVLKHADETETSSS